MIRICPPWCFLRQTGEEEIFPVWLMEAPALMPERSHLPWLMATLRSSTRNRWDRVDGAQNSWNCPYRDAFWLECSTGFRACCKHLPGILRACCCPPWPSARRANWLEIVCSLRRLRATRLRSATRFPRTQWIRDSDGPSASGTYSGQQAVEQRRAASADIDMDRRDGEDAWTIQRSSKFNIMLHPSAAFLFLPSNIQWKAAAPTL